MVATVKFRSDDINLTKRNPWFSAARYKIDTIIYLDRTLCKHIYSNDECCINDHTTDRMHEHTQQKQK